MGTESACKKSRVSGHFQPSPGSAPSPSRFPPHAPQVLFPLQTGTTTAASLPPAAVAQNTDSLQPQKHNKNPTEPEPRPGAREPRRERVPPPAATAQAPAGPGGTTGFLCYVLQRKGVMETRSGEGGDTRRSTLGKWGAGGRAGHSWAGVRVCEQRGSAALLCFFKLRGKKKKRGWESKVASIVEPNPRVAEDHTGSGAWGRRQRSRTKMADTPPLSNICPCTAPRGDPSLRDPPRTAWQGCRGEATRGAACSPPALFPHGTPKAGGKNTASKSQHRGAELQGEGRENPRWSY